MNHAARLRRGTQLAGWADGRPGGGPERATREEADVFEMAAPCEDCPFLRDGGARLVPARVREIAGNMLRPDGGAFFCHKTVDYADPYGAVTVDSQHCAGALLFALKNGTETQIMRLARRLGWDPAGLRGHERVFASADEMLRAASDHPAQLW